MITILGIVASSIGFAQQAEIVNGFEGFETWQPAEIGELPANWDGFNRNVLFNGMSVGSIECITKDSINPYEGQYSVQIKSTSVMGGAAVPGILTTGSLVIDWQSQNGSISGGEAYTQLPLSLSGQFKYQPVGDDTASVSITFTENGQVVGGGTLDITGTTSSWSSFNIDINYEVGAAPDSMNIIFTSSIQEGGNIIDGTVLEIDAIQLSSFLDVAQEAEINVKCYPNPATAILQIELNEAARETLQLINNQGQSVLVKNYNTSSIQLDVTSLSPGMYQLVLQNSKRIYNKRIIIQ
jgi:hypothetical protein